MKSTVAKIMVFLLLIGGICFSQNQISEAARYVFEKENARAVSYSVQNIQGFQNEFVLVNYASKDAANEYWLRLNLRKQGKISHDIKLDIDGTRYILEAVEKPDNKYYNAASSIFNGYPGLIRFYNLSPELVQKIRNAKQLKITFDIDWYTHPELNNTVVVENDFLKKFNYIAGLTYQDFPNYWPVIKDKKSLGLNESK
ncbi:MAG: hypothetical protein MR631_08155 [Selenomonadales bacterium]|nr:hypothetical protein [Selenomonadales bacterium]